MGRFDAMVGLTEAKAGVTYDEVTKALEGGGPKVRLKFKSYSGAKRVPGGFEVSFKSAGDAKALVKELGVGNVRKHAGQGRFWFADIPIADAKTEGVAATPDSESTGSRFDVLVGLVEATSPKARLSKRVDMIYDHAIAGAAAVRDIRDEVAQPTAYEKKLFKKAGDALASIQAVAGSMHDELRKLSEDSTPSGGDANLAETSEVVRQQMLASLLGKLALGLSLHKGSKQAAIKYAKERTVAGPVIWKLAKQQLGWAPGGEQQAEEDESALAEASASSDKEAIKRAYHQLGSLTKDINETLADINRSAQAALNKIAWPQGKADLYRAGMKKAGDGMRAAKQGITDATNVITQVSVGVREDDEAAPTPDSEPTATAVVEVGVIAASRFDELAGLTEAEQKMKTCPVCKAKVPVLKSGELMSHSVPHTQGRMSCPGKKGGKITRVTEDAAVHMDMTGQPLTVTTAAAPTIVTMTGDRLEDSTPSGDQAALTELERVSAALDLDEADSAPCPTCGKPSCDCPCDKADCQCSKRGETDGDDEMEEATKEVAASATDAGDDDSEEETTDEQPSGEDDDSEDGEEDDDEEDDSEDDDSEDDDSEKDDEEDDDEEDDSEDDQADEDAGSSGDVLDEWHEVAGESA